MRDAIEEGTRALGLELSSARVDRLARLLAELERWNRRINLTAIRDPAAMVASHVLDSLAVFPCLHGRTVLDIGTGAGFPGLPLAIAAPERQFTLVDSNGKKIGFVRHAIGLLGLDNVTAVKARAEDYAPGMGFDTVTARALATVPRLLELAGHLVGEDGRLLALKGRHPAEELESLSASSEWEYTVTRLNVPGLEAHERHFVILQRKDGRGR